MKRLLLTSALALILCGGQALAQDTSTSNAGSAATSQQAQGQSQTQGSITNGGSSANNGGVTVGPDTSNSNSTSGANSGSASNANNGGQTTTVGPTTVGSQTTGASTSTSNSGSTSVSKTKSEATGGAGGNAQTGAASAANSQNLTVNNQATDKLTTVPTVYAPALTTTLTETCMGSTSGGAAAMGWGASFGTSWRDAECVRRLDAREIEQLLGDREAARAILCGSKDVYDAYERIGRPCPGSPGYNPANAQAYLPTLPAPPAPPPPIVVNNNLPPVPQPLEVAPTSGFQMAPVPNPPEPEPQQHHYRPVHHHPHPQSSLQCPKPELQCPSKPH